MALVAGTTTKYEEVGMREDLEDTIWDLFPMDTWALTTLDKVDATATFHEWQTDALSGATANAQLEGDDASYATIVAPTRPGNYLQISRKQFAISGTVEAVTLAGRKSEIARQGMKQMRELKRDIEQAILRTAGSCAGTRGVARASGGMEAWIPSTDHGGNGQRATTTNAGSTIGFSAGVVTAPTDGGSFGGLAQTTFNGCLQLAWTDGGNPSVILTGPTYKAAIDSLTSQATRFVDVDSAGQIPILTAANVYVSDFGKHTVILSRYMRDSNPGTILMIDPDYWATAWLRKPFMEKLAKTGDAEKRSIMAEWTLVARNADSSAKLTGLT